MRLLAAERRIALEAQPAPAAGPEVVVRGDRTRIKQVLLNLLSNGIKYNRQGGHVRLSVSEQGERMVIEVADNGPGLTAEQQGRLFRDFERLDADRAAVQGAGIGLALSRRLIEMMAGEIGVHSVVGQGSRFWVRLPVAQAASGPAAPPAG